MPQVLIGRVGGELHSFDLEEIRQGAVQDANIFPEMKDVKMPEQMAAVLVSGVERKYWEHSYAMAAHRYNMGLYLPPYVLPQRAFEDDKEAQKTQVAIAAAKIHTGFIAPFNGYIEDLSTGRRNQFLTATAKKMGVADPSHILAVGDDRNALVDNVYLDALYGDLRDHPNEQVREIFESGHGVPGKRVKEVTSAQYGVAHSAYQFQEVTKELLRQGKQFSDARRMDTTLCIEQVSPGKLVFPENGIIVNAIGEPEQFLALTDKQLDSVKHGGRILTFDHINAVDYPGVKPGTSLHELKEKNPYHPYLTEKHSPGVAMTAFAAAMGIRQSEKKARKHFVPDIFNQVTNENKKGPKTVISSARLLTAGPEGRKVSASLNLPEGTRLSREQGRFLSLRDLENKLYAGQAFVIQDPDQFDIPENHGLVDKNGKKVSDEDIRLLQRLETALIYAYVITMSTQSGAPNHFARPHLVEKSYFKQYGMWHADMANLGLTGDVEQEAYLLVKNEKQLQKGLKSWDPRYYQHNPQRPKNDYISERCIKSCLRQTDLGYVVASYGSASSYLAAAFQDAFDINYALGRRRNVTNVNGGGARSAMLGMQEGLLKALAEGYDVRGVSIRSETDVSPLEGNIEDWIKGRGFDPVQGGDPRHIHYVGRHMNVFKLDRLLQRQDPIAALSHAAVLVPGGKGTVVEALISMYHNALVDIFGHGMFPGFSGNDRKKPLAISNHQFDYLGEDRGIFDGFLEQYRPYFDRLAMKEFTGENRIAEIDLFLEDHARSLGYDVSYQQPQPQQAMKPNVPTL